MVTDRAAFTTSRAAALSETWPLASVAIACTVYVPLASEQRKLQTWAAPIVTFFSVADFTTLPLPSTTDTTSVATAGAGAG